MPSSQQYVISIQMRTHLILIAVLLSLAPFAALAQTTPPLPRDRPNRDAVVEQAPETPAPAPEAVKIIEEEEATIEPVMDGPPQPVTFSAKITDDGAIIPNGLIWRVFTADTDLNGQLELVEKSENSVAIFTLKPGDYVVHVAYGRSQASDTIRIVDKPTAKTLILDSGAIRLGAAIIGELSIPLSDLRFSILTAGDSSKDGDMIAENVAPGTLVHLNAGIYHIVSYFGSVNAQVRADLRVEPGQLTDATLYHRAGQVSFKLVSETGGEAIADVDWTIKSADGETLYTSFGAFPVTILAEGDYTVLAKRGTNVYNREFQIQPGPSREIEVLTDIY